MSGGKIVAFVGGLLLEMFAAVWFLTLAVDAKEYYTSRPAPQPVADLISTAAPTITVTRATHGFWQGDYLYCSNTGAYEGKVVDSGSGYWNAYGYGESGHDYVSYANKAFARAALERKAADDCK